MLKTQNFSGLNAASVGIYNILNLQQHRLYAISIEVVIAIGDLDAAYFNGWMGVLRQKNSDQHICQLGPNNPLVMLPESIQCNQLELVVWNNSGHAVTIKAGLYLTKSLKNRYVVDE